MGTDQFELHSSTEIHWKHWVDGVLMADRVFTGLKPITYWNKLYLDQWISTGDGEAHEIKTYVDNIVIARDYIGPIGDVSSDTTPPAAPTGLAVR